jgi:signal peptidase I
VTDPADAAAPPATRRAGGLRWLRDLVVIVLVALLVSWGVRTFLVRSFFIPSASMEQTLLIGDRILVNELVPGVMDLHRGDVVVFEDPGGWLAAGEGDDLVKRVIGLPGDTVSCCDSEGRLRVDGEPLDEPYLNVPEGDPASLTPFEVTVPDGALWVMGDNRERSADSRSHVTGPYEGFVPLDHVVGRATVVFWPLGRWAVL